MTSRSGFFTLPRELRDTIYRLYVFEPDGYHYDYTLNKLRTSDNQPIQLDFMYTCSTIATEMHNLALGSNVINFSTVVTDPKVAYRFNMLLGNIAQKREQILKPLREPSMQRFRTSEMDSKLAIRYPRLEPLLRQPPDLYLHDGMRDMGLWYGSWGEAPSMYRAFQTYMLQLVSKDSEFAEALAQFEDNYIHHMDHFEEDPIDERPTEDRIALMNQEILELTQQKWRKRADRVRNGILLSDPEVWAIPSKVQFSEIATSFGFHWLEDQVEEEQISERAANLGFDGAEERLSWSCLFWKRMEWRFSAAAAAIRFLENLSLDTLLGIRKMVLHEDRRSVALPESHAQGLIPFCRQNPDLRIERRLSMWRLLLLGESDPSSVSNCLMEIYGHDDQRKREHLDDHCAHYLGNNACQWITEATALPAYGMPLGSFSLILDGDPLPELASEVFEVLKEEAAWQIAQMQWYANQSLNPDWIRTRSGGFYMSSSYPQAIKDIVEGKSFIRCNFPTGELYDPQRVLDRCRHINYDPSYDPDGYRPGRAIDKARYKERCNIQLRPLPPLPALFADLALEDVFPDPEQ